MDPTYAYLKIEMSGLNPYTCGILSNAFITTVGVLACVPVAYLTDVDGLDSATLVHIRDVLRARFKVDLRTSQLLTVRAEEIYPNTYDVPVELLFIEGAFNATTLRRLKESGITTWGEYLENG